MITTMNKDLFICGTCKNMFNEVQQYLEHKASCFLAENLEENIICSTDVCVESDSVLFTNQYSIDLTELENGVLPLILQFDKETEDSNVLEECQSVHSEGKDNANSKVISEIITSENNVRLSPAKKSSKEATTLGRKNLNSQSTKSCIVKESKEAKKVVAKTTKEANTRKGNKNACGICDFVTNRRHELTRHMFTHSGERPHECNICDKRFARQDKLQVHKRIHYGDKRYKCQVCEYTSTDSGALRTHLRIHSDTRAHRCQICSYAARNASHLTVHLRIHTGDCPFICQLDLCGRAFKTSSDLNRHMKVHSKKNLTVKSVSHEDAPDTISSDHVPRNDNCSVKKSSTCFGCKEFCRKVGVSRKRRGRPRRGVAAVSVRLKTHECPHCSAAFVRLDSLNSHLRQHPQSSSPPENSSSSKVVETCHTSTEPTETAEQLVESFLTDEELLSLDNFVTVPYISGSSVL